MFKTAEQAGTKPVKTQNKGLSAILCVGSSLTANRTAPF